MTTTSDKQVYTGYALLTQQHGYVVLSRDSFTQEIRCWSCYNQSRPAIAADVETAKTAADWLNAQGVAASIMPHLCYDGAWIIRL
jgi:hypothetical protein